MSSDLSVHLVQPTSTDQLLSASRVAMQELLALRDAPRLWIGELAEGAVQPVTVPMLDHPGRVLLVGLENSDNAVTLTITEIKEQLPHITEEDAGLWASVTVGVTRTPVAFALAASIAVALARECGTMIVDDGTIWTEAIAQSPETFARHVAVRGTLDDIENAAETMYAQLATQQRSRRDLLPMKPCQ